MPRWSFIFISRIDALCQMQQITGLGPITQINYNYNYFQFFTSTTIALLKCSNQLQLHHFNFNYICIMESHLLINLCSLLLIVCTNSTIDKQI